MTTNETKTPKGELEIIILTEGVLQGRDKMVQAIAATVLGIIGTGVWLKPARQILTPLNNQAGAATRRMDLPCQIMRH